MELDVGPPEPREERPVARDPRRPDVVVEQSHRDAARGGPLEGVQHRTRVLRVIGDRVEEHVHVPLGGVDGLDQPPERLLVIGEQTEPVTEADGERPKPAVHVDRRTEPQVMGDDGVDVVGVPEGLGQLRVDPAL